MARKLRQFCNACKQITTQVKAAGQGQWTCLCCESAKFRTQKQTAEVKKRGKQRARLNLQF